MRIDNKPRQLATYKALAQLAQVVLDPLADQFSKPVLTYGIAMPALTKNIKKRISPKIDQHAACELGRGGKPICGRLGAAVDFYVRDISSREIAGWLVTNTGFDRLYYYGEDRPLHVSIAERPSRKCTFVHRHSDGTVTPSTYTAERFIDVLR
jgi:hypothetical protein